MLDAELDDLILMQDCRCQARKTADIIFAAHKQRDCHRQAKLSLLYVEELV
jgi:hypothetical protein